MTICNKCGRNIIWKKTPDGKFIPYNLDDICHFDTCKPNQQVIEWFKKHPKKGNDIW